MDRIRLPEIRDQWRALMNTVMNIRAPLKLGSLILGDLHYKLLSKFVIVMCPV
jgi:hypothetical protein